MPHPNNFNVSYFIIWTCYNCKYLGLRNFFQNGSILSFCLSNITNTEKWYGIIACSIPKNNYDNICNLKYMFSMVFEKIYNFICKKNEV